RLLLRHGRRIVQASFQAARPAEPLSADLDGAVADTDARRGAAEKAAANAHRIGRQIADEENFPLPFVVDAEAAAIGAVDMQIVAVEPRELVVAQPPERIAVIVITEARDHQPLRGSPQAGCRATGDAKWGHRPLPARQQFITA